MNFRRLRELTCLLLTAVLAVVSGQAPGDEQELCTVTLPSIGENVIVDPPNQIPLMDSSHYENLLPPRSNPVWQRVDNDDNNDSGQTTTWIEQGSSCVSEITVCGYEASPQDNWLITQFINRTVDGNRLPQVTVQIEYTQTNCVTDTGTANNCQRFFDLFRYERSSVDPAAARNTGNYQFINTLVTQDTTGLSAQNITQDITFSTEESGFYLAVRDAGTCIVIPRLVVFYYVCPSQTVDLVVRPETIAPGSGVVAANCVDNASPRSGDSAKLTCLERGAWFPLLTSMCVCEDGFIESNDGQHCLPCEPGLYASVAAGMCLVCPENSNSTVQGLAECPCDPGYYRTAEEVDLPCTQTPSPPINLTLVGITRFSVNLSWEEPVSTGGRNRTELRYNLWYRAAGDTEITLFATVNTTRGEITGLSSGVEYEVFVSAENDVSEQVPPNSQFAQFIKRAASLNVTTTPFSVDALTIIGLIVGILQLFLCLMICLLCRWCGLRKKRERRAKRTRAIASTEAESDVELSHFVTNTCEPMLSEADSVYYNKEMFSSVLVPYASLTVGEVIGEGAFGIVYRGEMRTGTKPEVVAIKTLKSLNSQAEVKSFLSECLIMKDFSHPNILSLAGVCFDTPHGTLYILLPYMANGSVRDYLRNKRVHVTDVDTLPEDLNVGILVRMCLDIVNGMEYLASIKFVHRDLAARNCMLDTKLAIKVGDFGLTRDIYTADYYRANKDTRLPVKWMPPETLHDGISNEKTDVWSYGVTCWEVFSLGRTPYPGIQNGDMLNHISSNERLEKPSLCRKSLYEMIMFPCWKMIPEDRPTFTDLAYQLQEYWEIEHSYVVESIAGHQ